MPHLFRRLIGTCLIVTLAGALPVLAQDPKAGPKQSAPAKAGYVEINRSTVPVTLTLTGRATAFNSTQLRPRVGGIVTQILYQPGSLVEAGTPLFTIDPLTYQLALASAEAAKASAEAVLSETQRAYERAVQLSKSAASSQANLQTAEATLRRAEASLKTAEADLDLAKAQLEWTTVRAPIRGVVGVAQVSVGDLVTQSQASALTEIVQTAPVYLDLNEPWPTRLREEARAAAGEIQLLPQPQLTVLSEDGRAIAEGAKLISTGTSVAASTGTRNLRFEFENARGLIAPGAFLHAKLVIGTQEAILVPQRATTRERDGSLSAWVEQDGKAQKRKLTETGNFGNAWVVTAGLTPGERLLIDGTSTLRDGQALEVVLAEIDKDGVVRDVAPQENTATPTPASASRKEGQKPSDRPVNN